MTNPVMIQALGESNNIRMLNFFLENPFDSYNKSQIAKYSEISRNSVYKYLPEFIEKGYILQEKDGEIEVFRLNRENSIIVLINQFVDKIGTLYLSELSCKSS